ncbi:cell division ATP-binding protein FtsE [Muricoccus vinaceus]|uniref:Cell division ATP-binding protein FtsE n=1 Tax=Muricoccus vinaceus TaxID=424704 RepID=A0ABV6IXK5_9PROT
MVRFSQVGLSYPDPVRGGSSRGEAGERETLHDLSFTLPQGSFTWLTGPSGAGKTSLLRLMQLALRPTRGEVEVLGVPLSRAQRGDLPRLRRRIGAVFQEFRLLPYLTAFDNVALPLRLAGRTEASLRPDVAEMLRWVGLAGREEALPPQLSGGEQQRVAIARAVVTRPALLVADEPTGNLDPVQARRLLLLLAEMNRLGATVVVATHSRELIAQLPGHVMALDAGRIVSLEPWPYGAPGTEPTVEPALPAAPEAALESAPESGPKRAPGAEGHEAAGNGPGLVPEGGEEPAIEAGRMRRLGQGLRSIWPRPDPLEEPSDDGTETGRG